jgi:eukaryotic-like serine/threonine-protein kinase
MQPERRQQIEALFEAALERPSAVRREWLVGVCEADPEMHAAVLRLLNAHERAEGILEGPRPTLTQRPAESVEGAHPPERRIGAYRLEREIGRGGMSIVYLAERDDHQFRQTVAVKLIRRGLDTPDLVRRFCAERQILASLNHPHIARLLDGGTTEDGLPYLVMEHVPGEPITEYCDRRRLTLAQRLKLFVTVARTVQHAHRNLVVHRDLKPSNILVTEALRAGRGEGDVRLLDFGIAKLLDPDASPDAPPQTRPGVRLMTPEYASPEQIDGGAVTTATDVYGLGLVLYELLCGHHPFAPTAPGEHRRRSRDHEPPRPSSRVAGDAEVARVRHVSPERLRRKLRGDLDRIVLTALRPEPERRYPSAEQLAEDVEHFLQRRPIRARGDSVPYRLGRFAARNRWGVAAAALFVLLLGSYAATVTVKEREVSAALERAGEEAERAEEVTAFLMRLFEAADPSEVGSAAITAPELLERGARRIEEFSDRPAVQAQMLDVIGRTYQYLGQFDRAQPLLERALALRRGLFGTAHASVAESLYHLARLHHGRGQLEHAGAFFDQALQIQRRLPGEERPRVARTLGGLALVLQDRGEYAGAEALAREALALRRQARGREHAEVADGLHDLAEILRRRGEYAEAEALHREALELRMRLLGEGHPAVARTMDNLAALLQRRGDLSEVESLYRRALGIYRARFGPEHPATATTTSNLGLLMFRMGDLAAADSLYREALAIRRSVLGPEHPDVALSLGLLAAVQRRKGNLVDADTLYRQSLAMQRRLLGEEHPDLGHGMNGLAMVLRDQGRFAEADSLYRAVLALRLRVLGPEHSSVASTLNDRGVLLREWGRYAEAEPLLLQGLQLRRQTLNEGHLQIEQSLRHLVRLYERWGRPEQAAVYREMLGGR